MEYKHQHLLEQLAAHKDAFRKVGVVVEENHERILNEWRTAFYNFFGGIREGDHPAAGMAEAVYGKILNTLLDWDPRRHLEGATCVGVTLAGREMALDDVVVGYHFLQETLRRVIRANMADDFTDAWEAMDDYHAHTLAVLIGAFQQTREEMRHEAGAEDKREFLSQLEMARGIQGKLIPKRFQNHYLKAVSKLKTVDAIGGDIFYIHRVSNQLAFFAIADAEGHGVPAALNMMALTAHFQTVLSNYYTPEYVAQYLNWMIINEESGIPPTSGIFLTIDGRNGELRLVNAGHPDPILIKEKSSEIITIHQGNLVLGLSTREEYKAQSIPFAAGDKLILFTDGLIDFKASDGELLGMHRLIDLFAETRMLTCEEMLDKLMAYLEKEERIGGKRTDDILIVGIEARGAEWRTVAIPDVSIQDAKEIMLAELKGLGLAHDIISDLHVVMDELMDNALCHGNNMDPGLPIKLDYLATPDEFRIKVTDSGEGFDWRSSDMLMDKDKILSPSGRGLYFISSLMNEVLFNDRGNQVTAIKRFDR